MPVSDPLNRARNLVQAGSVAEAWNPLRCALAMDPSSGPGLTLAGQIVARRGASGPALRYFERAAQASDPEDHRVLLNLARAQHLAGDVVSAISTIRRTIDLHPQEGQARGLLAFFLIAEGRVAEGAEAVRSGGDLRLDGKVAAWIGGRLAAHEQYRDLATGLLLRAVQVPGTHQEPALAELLKFVPATDTRSIAGARRVLIANPASVPAMEVTAADFAARSKPVREVNWLWRSWIANPDGIGRLERVAQGTFEARRHRHALAANLELLNRRPDAFESIDRVCRLLDRLKDRARALSFGRERLQASPDDPRVWDAIAGLYKTVGAIDEADALWRETLHRFPQYNTLFYNCSLFLDEQNRLEEAARRARAALILKPDYTICSNHLSIVEHRLHRADLAFRYVRWTLTVQPNHANAHLNRGNYYRTAGLYGRAIASYRRAAQAAGDGHPITASSRYNAGMSKIGIGEVEDGFKLIEARWATREFPSPKRAFRQRIWPGPHHAPDAGLLLYMEQGLGDEVMMSWYLPLVRRDVRRLVVDCDSRLIPLFSRTFEGVEFVPATVKGDPKAHSPDLQFKTPSFHVPQYYVSEIKRLIRDNWNWAQRGGTRFPSRLALEPERLERWRGWLQEQFPGRPRVAVSWRSRVRNRDRDRQYLSVEELASVIPPGSVAINLQYSSTEDELSELRELGERLGFEVVSPDGVDLTDDLEDILAILQEVDATVTPLISLAWMAGAIGCPTFVFRTSAESLLWHQMGTPFLPWAPSLKLFFRHPAEPWGATITDVRHALSAYLRTASPSR